MLASSGLDHSALRACSCAAIAALSMARRTNTGRCAGAPRRAMAASTTVMTSVRPDRPCRMDCQAFAGMLVNQRQNAKAASILSLVFDKVPTPHLPEALRSLALCCRQAQPPHAALALADFKPFLTPKPGHSLGVDFKSIPAQQSRDPAVSIARMTPALHALPASPVKTAPRQTQCPTGGRPYCQTLPPRSFEPPGDSLQATAFLFQGPQPAGLSNVHPAVLPLPCVIRRLTDEFVMLEVEIRSLLAFEETALKGVRFERGVAFRRPRENVCQEMSRTPPSSPEFLVPRALV